MVLISAMAMFTAVGASAFVVKARACKASKSCRAKQAKAVPPRVESFRDEAVREFRQARARGDLEAALLAYQRLGADTKEAAELSTEREEVANAFLRSQLELAATEAENGACLSARERLTYTRSLVGDRETIPVDMADCIVQAEPGPTYDGAIQEAKSAFQAGNYADALRHSKAALAARPSDPVALSLATMSACNAKLGEEAQLYADTLQGVRRDMATQSCLRQGIELR